MPTRDEEQVVRRAIDGTEQPGGGSPVTDDQALEDEMAAVTKQGRKAQGRAGRLADEAEEYNRQLRAMLEDYRRGDAVLRNGT